MVLKLELGAKGERLDWHQLIIASVEISTEVGLGLLALPNQLPCETTAATSEIEYIAGRITIAENRIAGGIIKEQLLSSPNEGTHLQRRNR